MPIWGTSYLATGQLLLAFLLTSDMGCWQLIPSFQYFRLPAFCWLKFQVRLLLNRPGVVESRSLLAHELDMLICPRSRRVPVSFCPPPQQPQKIEWGEAFQVGWWSLSPESHVSVQVRRGLRDWISAWLRAATVACISFIMCSFRWMHWGLPLNSACPSHKKCVLHFIGLLLVPKWIKKQLMFFSKACNYGLCLHRLSGRLFSSTFFTKLIGYGWIVGHGYW